MNLLFWRKPKMQTFTTQCVECNKPIVSTVPGPRVHFGCIIEKDKRDKEEASVQAAKRARIDEIKTALHEYFSNNEGPK